MSVDYDLIILGATPAGIQAAIAAATLKARVALITQGITSTAAPELVAHHALLHVAQARKPAQFPLPSQGLPAMPDQWHQVTPWLEAVVTNVEATRLTGLAYQGVDVIDGRGEFSRNPTLQVQAGDRSLQARGYLLTIDGQPLLPPIPGLETVAYSTPATFPSKLATLAPNAQVAILGSGKTAVELAQALSHLGLQTTLLTQQPCLLPEADRDVSQHLQAQLEADGVVVRLQTLIHQIQAKGGQAQVYLDAEVFEVDEIVLATGQAPSLAALNLDVVGVKWSSHGLVVNPKQQTTNPRIYACEGRWGGECFAHLATAEATIALKNILFLPWFTVNVQSMPLVIHTSPAVAWVGLTETQAIRRYGHKKVFILQQAFHTLPKAHMRNDLDGFCKLIVHRNGNLLGGHLIGEQTSELINILALAMRHKLKIGAIADLPCPTPTLAAILRHTAATYRSLSLKHHAALQDLIDHCFDLQRVVSRN
jgi:pyruvate/2-oxoglutarate dehydrogenase complex dihydrolipoamide dehydrogenase (E3) component